MNRRVVSDPTHRWIHSGHAPYKCNECDRAFTHLSHLKSHRVREHGQEKSFACNECDKKFLYAYQLRTHVNSVHREKRDEERQDQGQQQQQQWLQTLFQCALCQDVFDSFEALQQHCAAGHGVELSSSNNAQQEQQVQPSETNVLVEVPRVVQGVVEASASQDQPQHAQFIQPQPSHLQQFVIVYETENGEKH